MDTQDKKHGYTLNPIKLIGIVFGKRKDTHLIMGDEAKKSLDELDTIRQTSAMNLLSNAGVALVSAGLVFAGNALTASGDGTIFGIAMSLTGTAALVRFAWRMVETIPNTLADFAKAPLLARKIEAGRVTVISYNEDGTPFSYRTKNGDWLLNHRPTFPCDTPATAPDPEWNRVRRKATKHRQQGARWPS